nr:hypothetical protein [Tanacetum cinerariifolium]
VNDPKTRGVIPFEEPKRVIHSTRKLSKTTSLDYFSSPEFDLFSDPDNRSEEEFAERMGEPTMEEYMMKTQEDYGSGIARLKINDKAHFQLKGQFLKELPDAAIRNQGASIKALEIQIGQMSKEALERSLMEKPRMGYQIKALINVHDSAILEDSLPLKEKDPMSFTIPCFINPFCFEKALADLRASVSVMPYSTFTNLGPGELTPSKLIIELADRIIKDPKGLREQKELDLKARLIGEALILNRSLDHIYGDYIKLNDLNKPLELRRNQVENLGPTIKDGEVINEPMEDIVEIRNDDEKVDRINEYLSFHDFYRKIHINYIYNLQFSCTIDKVDDKRKDIVGAFINVPIFVGIFYVVTDFAVVENMDAYQDQDMGKVIDGKQFCKAFCVEARRFDRMITI